MCEGGGRGGEINHCVFITTVTSEILKIQDIPGLKTAQAKNASILKSLAPTMQWRRVAAGMEEALFLSFKL
jgi:hypothetical protein